MIPNERFNSGLHEWQCDMLSAFDRRQARFIVLEWHRRARKTTLGLNLLIRECCRYPKRTYVYVAPTYTQARNIIWDDPNMLDAYLPTHDEIGWRKNEQKLHIRFANGSVLAVRGGDNPDSLRGIDAAGVVFDEWAMLKPAIWTEIFRPIIAQDSKRWALFAYTPKGQNHATIMFDRAIRLGDPGVRLPDRGAADTCLPEWYASRLDGEFTGLLPPAELEKARSDMSPSMYDQEIRCARVTDEERVLITSAMLADLQHYERHGQESRRAIACDPSMGGDECVIYVGDTGSPRFIIDQQILRERDTMKIVGHLGIMGAKHKIELYGIDTIGVGKGIGDRLSEMGKTVIPFCSSEASNDPTQFANLRAAAYWYTMNRVRAHDVPYPADALLRRQLSSLRYKTPQSNGRLLIEPKDEYKRREGHSPDRADAYVILNWTLQFATPEENRRTRGRVRWKDDLTARKPQVAWQAY